MKRTKSVLLRTQPSGNSFLLTLVHFNKPLIQDFRFFLKNSKIKNFFTSNFAHFLTQRTLSIGFDVNCGDCKTAQKIIKQVEGFCTKKELIFKQQKMKIPGHNNAGKASFD